MAHHMHTRLTQMAFSAGHNKPVDQNFKQNNLPLLASFEIAMIPQAISIITMPGITGSTKKMTPPTV